MQRPTYRFLVTCVLIGIGIRYATSNGSHHARVRAPGYVRFERRAVDLYKAVIFRAFIRGELAPFLNGSVEFLALRHLRPSAHILEGRVVGGDHACARAAFDGHVAYGHPAFHRHGANHLTGVFDCMACRARNANLADDAEYDILRRNAQRQLAVDADFHRLGLELAQRLSGKHMLHFRCANAHSERAECAVRRGVAVAAYDDLARLRVTLLRPYDVDNALKRAEPIVQRYAEVLAVPV